MKFIFTLFLALNGLNFVFGQSVSVSKLIALNLEEDKGSFDTLNDEVMLIWGIIDMANDSIAYWAYSEIFEMNDSINEHVFNHNSSPNLDSSFHLLFLLVEVDNEQKASAISDGIKAEFKLYYAHPYNLLKEQLRLQLGENDLLGFLYFAPKNIKQIGDTLSFKGVHMFNRFEYGLELNIE
jgi:hypothetical protein